MGGAKDFPKVFKSLERMDNYSVGNFQLLICYLNPDSMVGWFATYTYKTHIYIILFFIYMKQIDIICVYYATIHTLNFRYNLYNWVYIYHHIIYV